MSTRGVFGFLIDGQTKAFYNCSDSYPEGLGKNVLLACAKTEKFAMWPVVEDRVRNITMVHERAFPTQTELKMMGMPPMPADGFGVFVNWGDVLQDKAPKIDAVMEGKSAPFAIDSAEFLSNSAFCEWAYIINLDEQCIEIHVGSNDDADAPGRYVNLMPPDEYGTYGVKHLLSIPFAATHGLGKSVAEHVCSVITTFADTGDVPDGNWFVLPRAAKSGHTTKARLPVRLEGITILTAW